MVVSDGTWSPFRCEVRTLTLGLAFTNTPNLHRNLRLCGRNRCCKKFRLVVCNFPIRSDTLKETLANRTFRWALIAKLHYRSDYFHHRPKANGRCHHNFWCHLCSQRYAITVINAVYIHFRLWCFSLWSLMIRLGNDWSTNTWIEYLYVAHVVLWNKDLNT